MEHLKCEATILNALDNRLPSRDMGSGPGFGGNVVSVLCGRPAKAYESSYYVQAPGSRTRMIVRHCTRYYCDDHAAECHPRMDLPEGTVV